MALSFRSTLTVFLCVTCFAALASAEVLVVDPAGGPVSDFSDLGLAVIAAADGDTLLLRAGTHGASQAAKICVSGKSVRLVADSGAAVIIASPFVVQNLSVNQSFTARGIRFFNNTSPLGDQQVEVVGNMGSVWFEACQFGGAAGFSLVFGDLSVADSQAVTIQRCSFLVSLGSPLLLDHSNVFLHDSTVNAPNVPFFSDSGSTGPAAAILIAGSLFASASRFEGGDGSCGVLCPFGQDGGPGLQTSLGAVVRLLDSELVGGAPDGPPGDTGEQGLPLEDLDGTVTIENLPGEAASLAIGSPAREGQSIQLLASGPESSQAFLISSFAPGGLYLPGKGASLLIDPALVFLPLLPVPAGGQITFSISVPELGPLIEAVPLYVQAGFSEASGALTTSGGSAVEFLDGGF